jgi:hypothetical protein
MNGQEILDKLQELANYGVLSPGDFYNYGLKLDYAEYADYTIDDLYDEDKEAVQKILAELGETEMVTNDSPDSEWDYYSRVVNRFVKHNVFIETKAHYTSYEGTEYEDGFGTEVVPVEKVFTVYEEVK